MLIHLLGLNYVSEATINNVTRTKVCRGQSGEGEVLSFLDVICVGVRISGQAKNIIEKRNMNSLGEAWQNLLPPD